MKCDCKDWKENKEKLDGIFLISHIHGIKYNGIPFKYCPWCGKELKEENELVKKTVS